MLANGGNKVLCSMSRDERSTGGEYSLRCILFRQIVKAADSPTSGHNCVPFICKDPSLGDSVACECVSGLKLFDISYIASGFCGYQNEPRQSLL